MLRNDVPDGGTVRGCLMAGMSRFAAMSRRIARLLGPLAATAVVLLCLGNAFLIWRYTLLQVRVSSEITNLLLYEECRSDNPCIAAGDLGFGRWSKCWIVNPYVDSDSISGVPWRVRWIIGWSGIESRDHFTLLVILLKSGGYTIAYESLGRLSFDLEPIVTITPDNTLCFQRSLYEGLTYYKLSTIR